MLVFAWIKKRMNESDIPLTTKPSLKGNYNVVDVLVQQPTGSRRG